MRYTLITTDTKNRGRPGTNNSGDNTPQEIADGIMAICLSVRKKLPDTKILLLRIFPRSGADSKSRKVTAKASELASAIADGDMIHYLDINKHFLNENNVLICDITPDDLHLHAKGYQIWAEAMEDKLAELIGEDRR